MDKIYFKLSALFSICIFITLIISACEKNDEKPIIKPPISEKEILRFAYSKEYGIYDLNMYIGEDGRKINLDENTAQRIRNYKNINEPEFDSIIYLVNKDSLCIKHANLSLQYAYKIKVKDDSIFARAGNDKYYYYGKLIDNKSLIVRYGFNYLTKEPKPENGMQIGGGAIMNRNFIINGYNNCFYQNSFFQSPLDMKNKGDTVAWCSVKYTFKLTN